MQIFAHDSIKTLKVLPIRICKYLYLGLTDGVQSIYDGTVALSITQLAPEAIRSAKLYTKFI